MRPSRIRQLLEREFLAGLRGVHTPVMLWGPPGVGKTTLGRLLAHAADAEFVAFSAVSDGVARVREVVAEAEQRREEGRGTILFVDEIHRMSRAVEEVLYPAMEDRRLDVLCTFFFPSPNCLKCPSAVRMSSFALACNHSRTKIHFLLHLVTADINFLRFT